MKPMPAMASSASSITSPADEARPSPRFSKNATAGFRAIARNRAMIAQTITRRAAYSRYSASRKSRTIASTISTVRAYTRTVREGAFSGSCTPVGVVVAAKVSSAPRFGGAVACPTPQRPAGHSAAAQGPFLHPAAELVRRQVRRHELGAPGRAGGRDGRAVGPLPVEVLLALAPADADVVRRRVRPAHGGRPRVHGAHVVGRHVHPTRRLRAVQAGAVPARRPLARPPGGEPAADPDRDPRPGP